MMFRQMGRSLLYGDAILANRTNKDTIRVENNKWLHLDRTISRCKLGSWKKVEALEKFS